MDALSEEKPVDKAWRQTQRFLEEQEQKLDTMHRELNKLMNEINCLTSSEENKKEEEVINGEEDSGADVGNTPADASKTLISAGLKNGSKLTAMTNKTVTKTPLLLHCRGLGSNNSMSHLVSLSPNISPNSTGDDKKEQGAAITTESLDILTDLLERQPEEDALMIPVDIDVIEKLKEKAAMRRRSVRGCWE